MDCNRCNTNYNRNNYNSRSNMQRNMQNGMHNHMHGNMQGNMRNMQNRSMENMSGMINMSMKEDEGCNKMHEHVDHMNPGMGYVPWQKWEEIYDMEKGFERGTIFCQLDKPYTGRAMK